MFRRRDWASIIVQAELTGEKVAEAGKIEYETVVKEKPKSTKVYEVKDVTLDKNSVFVDVEGYGKVNEVLFRTDSKNYRILIIVDGKETFNDTYSHFEEISKFIEKVGTKTVGGYHLISFTDISFSSSLYIRVEPSESMIFKSVFISYVVS